MTLGTGWVPTGSGLILPRSVVLQLQQQQLQQQQGPPVKPTGPIGFVGPTPPLPGGGKPQQIGFKVGG